MSVDANAEFLEFRNVDKIKFIGTSSNTIIDTTTGRLGIGTDTPAYAIDVRGTANVTALSGITDFNFQPTSNTASIEYDSNVVTEFNRSKKLIKYPRVVLTANGLNQGYTVSGSDDYSSGLTFYGAFTPPTTLSTPSGAWLTPTSGTNGYSTSTGEYGYSEQLHSASLTGEYVQIVLPEKINPVYFTVQPYPESANNEGLLSCINEGEIWASNDSGTTWTPVGKIQNFTPTGLYQEHIVDNFNVPGYYDTFALIIHKNNGHPFAGVGEWKIFGTPEYDPDAHGTDIVVKSLPNVPNTDWLDVYYDGQDYTSTPATVTDNSGNNLTGTLNGGVGFDTGYKAFTFDGVDDYISNIQSGYTGSNTYTVGMWFNRAANIQGALFSYGIASSTSPTAIAMFYYGSANHYITSYIAGSVRANTDFNASYLSLNEWNHAASVYSPKGVTLYINGVMVAKNTIVSPIWNNSITIPTSPHLTIGAQGDTTGTGIYPNTYFTGSIANFRLFKRALTSDEIWQLYAYQKEYFGRGDLGMTLKAGRLGIGTSEPRAALDVRGRITREYNPGEIIEELTTVCNGRPVTVLSGTYTPTNVTGSQTSSTTHTEIDGSNITYNKPVGAKRIYYKFACQWHDESNGAITHFKIRVYHNGAWRDINPSRYTHAAQYRNDGNHHGQAWVINEYIFECDAETESQNDGRFLSSKTSYTFDVTWRQYGVSDYNSILHINEWWDGTGTDTVHPPQLTIRAIA